MLVALCFFAILQLVNLILCIKMEPKIVGGNYTNIEKFPHSAFLLIECVTEQGGGMWMCGSSIINQRVLLTAAHCLADCTSNSWISVSVGHVDMLQGSVSSCSSYVIHENYYADGITNDIALVKVKTTLEFSTKVSRIALIKDPPYYEKAQLAGWGLVNEVSEQKGDVLKAVDQYVHDYKDCLNLLGRMPTGTLCASSGTDSDYAAKGDSGSALIVHGYIQIGIVSFKRPSVSRSIIVYTDTGYFYDWIKDNAEMLFCDEKKKNFSKSMARMFQT